MRLRLSHDAQTSVENCPTRRVRPYPFEVLVKYHNPDAAQSRIIGMPGRLQPTPRSCDLLHLAHRADAHDATADSRGGTFLVWLINDQDTVVIRSAASLSAAVEVARAYREAWSGRVHYIEAPDGSLVARADWERLLGEQEVPLPYMWTVELRTPPSARDGELVTALWTTTNLDEALQWRTMLPAHLRSRSLIVSDAPDRH